MNITVAHIPKKWKPNNSIAFAKWYKNKVKSKFLIDEDFNLLKDGN